MRLCKLKFLKQAKNKKTTFYVKILKFNFFFVVNVRPQLNILKTSIFTHIMNFVWHRIESFWEQKENTYRNI